VAVVGPRAFQALKRTQDRALLEPTVEPYPRGSGFVRDELELEHRVAQAISLHAQLTITSHKWAHLEADQSRKIVLQRGGPPGWFVIPEGLVNEESPSMGAAFNKIAEWVAAQPEAIPLPPRYKMGTVHGWPDYRRTHASYLLHALWARASEDITALHTVGMELAGILGEGTPFSATMFTRTGPLGKPVPGISQTATGAVIDASLTGLCCRRRIVFGMPSAGNMWQVSAVDQLKSRVQHIPFFYHRGPADVARKVAAVHRPDWEWFSDDISAYDQSVSDTHQRELIDRVYAPLASEGFAAFKHQWKDLSLLAPPLTTTDEAFLYRKKGMTPSGDLTTAMDGTLINAARVLTCAAHAMGVSVDAARERWGSSWCAFIQGDDTILGYARGALDLDDYETMSLDLGYKAKVVPGVVFLMHLIDPVTGAWAPLTSRVFQQTVFNEYGGRHPAVELFSFIARATPTFWNVNPWAGAIDKMLRDGECFVRYGVRPVEARKALRDAVFQAELAEELKTVPQRDARFKGVDLSGLSDAASALLAGDSVDAPLPAVSREVALRGARRIAAFMAMSEEDRPAGDIPHLAPELQDYYNTITSQGATP
jgi:hypothetical protein